MSVRVVDNSKKFSKKAEQALDMAMNTAAVDIERAAKLKVPKKNGQLQSSIRHHKKGFMRYRVDANMEYAAYQHRGARRDGSYKVRKYTKPGTGKHFLSEPGERISEQLLFRFKKALKVV